MHSSISNSEGRAAERRYARAVPLAIAAILVFVIACEAIARIGFAHLSKIEGRVASEHNAARAIRPGQKPSILMLGNSLLIFAMDYPRIREEMKDRARVGRFVVEQTQFWDWYYGIRRLLAEGARPDVIILCISQSHLVATSTLGEYASFYLFPAADLHAVARRGNYDLTQESGLYFARFSLFFAGRGNLRNFVLNRADPPYAAWRHGLTRDPPALPSSDELERIDEERFRLLQSEVRQYGSRLVFLVPPATRGSEAEVMEAARRTGTEVMVPFPAGALPQRLFWDGFHLDEEGASLFTGELERGIRARLDSWAPASVK